MRLMLWVCNTVSCAYATKYYIVYAICSYMVTIQTLEAHHVHIFPYIITMYAFLGFFSAASHCWIVKNYLIKIKCANKWIKLSLMPLFVYESDVYSKYYFLLNSAQYRQTKCIESHMGNIWITQCTLLISIDPRDMWFKTFANEDYYDDEEKWP